MGAPSLLEGLIQRHEGLRLLPYTDSTGHLTIGYGHNLSNGITASVAEYIFQQDLVAVEQRLAADLDWWVTLNDVRQAVLIDMGFNLGVNVLYSFQELMLALSKQNWTEAAQAMLESKWAHEVPTRANEDAELMRTGEWPSKS